VAGRGRWWALLAAAAAGALLVLAFPPYGLWPLAVVAVAGLSWLTRGVTARRGALLGSAFGLAFFIPLLSWSGIFVGPAPWLLLAVSQTAFVAALGAALAVTSRLPAWPLWAAALWVAEEAARSRLPWGGFPWGRLAFSQAGSPLVWLSAYGGAPLVTLAVALLGTALAAAVPALAGGRWRAATPALAAAVATAAASGAAWAAGDWQTGTARTVTVAVVQGNVPRLGLDFNAQREAVLRNHVGATFRLAADADAGRVARPDLVLWPENASDIDPIRYPDARALIAEAGRAIGVPILVGTLADGPTARTVRNVGIVWDPATGPGERYVKRHPVPFAEYIPLRGIARMVSSDVDRVGRDFVGGDRPGRLRAGPVEVGDVICFEVAYDGLVRDVSGADLLVVQTNNATFGRSAETWQQLAMGRLRAVEHGRTVLVAATSGVSAVISPDGHVPARSDVFTADVLVRAVEVREGATLATRWGAGPEWVVVAVALAALVGAVARSRRTRGAHSSGNERQEKESA
jgi:apolipoprotein N-acyltransferase